jgi:hypothetical protein
MVLERIANPSLDESRVLSSSLSRSASLLRVRPGHYSGLISQEHRWFKSNTRNQFMYL